jgi:hypothetical protein
MCYLNFCTLHMYFSFIAHRYVASNVFWKYFSYVASGTCTKTYELSSHLLTLSLGNPFNILKSMPRFLKWSLPHVCFLSFSTLQWTQTNRNQTHLSCNTKFCCYLFSNSGLKHVNGQTVLHSKWLTSCVKFWGRTLPSMANPWHCKRNIRY